MQADFGEAAATRELSCLFAYLAQQEIDHCVLQPCLEQPLLPKTDLDLYVENKRIADVDKYLLATGWSRVPAFRFPRIRRFYAKSVGLRKLKLDLSIEYAVFSKQGRHRYNGEIVKKASRAGIPYLDDLAACAFILMKGELDTGTLSSEKTSALKLLSARDSGASSLVQQKDGQAIRRLFTRVTQGRLSLVRRLFAALQQARIGSGSLTISFVGLDGAGKGTYIEKLSRELEHRSFHLKIVYLGHSCFQLRVVRYLAEKRSHYQAGVRRRIYLALYFALLPLELLFRRGRGRCDLMITDRHPLFEKVGQGRNLSRFYDALLAVVSPRPDLVIHLTGDPRVVWARKQELTFEEYRRRNDHLLQTVAQYAHDHNVVSIDTGKDKELVFAEILEAVLHHAESGQYR